MRCSIVMTCHNEGDRLWKTVASCKETCKDLDHEIIVVDDASEDDSIDQLREKFPDLPVTVNTERIGTSRGKDKAARLSTGDVLMFLDAHCKPEANAIEKLVEDVEQFDGKIIATPRIAALDTDTWETKFHQIGHGYRMTLKDFECAFVGIGEMEKHEADSRIFYQSPLMIGCCVAITRSLYEELFGFDTDMQVWGSEDIDLALKARLMGYDILHDPQPLIGHRFQQAFDRYTVPMEHALVNQMRTARKHFTEPVWTDWLEQFEARQDKNIWAKTWDTFEQYRPSVEKERDLLMNARVHDEFWFAERFGLDWPKKSHYEPS